MKDKEKKKINGVKKAKKVKPSATKKKVKPDAADTNAKKKVSSVRKKVAPKVRESAIKDSPDTVDNTSLACNNAPETRSAEVEDPGSLFVSGVASGMGDEIVNEDGTITFIKGDENGDIAGDEEYLMFRYSGAGYSLRVTDVMEILKHQRITRVPGSAEHVFGAISMRGVIVPVLNLGSLLCLEDTVPPEYGRILMLRGAGIVLGILVEKGIRIMRLYNEDLKPPVSGISDNEAAFVEGVFDVGGEFFSVLRPDKITRTKATGRLNETKA